MREHAETGPPAPTSPNCYRDPNVKEEGLDECRHLLACITRQRLLGLSSSQTFANAFGRLPGAYPPWSNGLAS